MPRGDNFRRHDSLYAKLMTNVIEDGNCWLGTERDLANYGYVRVSIRDGERLRKCMSHILVYVLQELAKLGITSPTNAEVWWAYWEFRCSGLEIDHKCNVPACRRPDHLQPATRREQELFKHERRKVLPNIEHDPAEIEF